MITILVVEDAQGDRETYGKILSEMNDVKVLEAESAEAALQILEMHQVDMFFLDVELPGMNGFKLAKRIRGMPAYVMAPILFVTAHSKDQLKVYEQLHCYGYIVKPFRTEELKRRMLTLIKEYRMTRSTAPLKERKIVQLLTAQGIVPVITDQIVFAESNRMACTVYLTGGMLKLPRMALINLIKVVGEDFFVQCHKSFAVNVYAISSIAKIDYRLYRIYLNNYNYNIDMTNTFKEQVEAAQLNCLHKGGGYDGVE